MSKYQMIAIKQEAQQMGVLQIIMIALFMLVLFFSFVVPALKDRYGASLLVSNQTMSSGVWNY